MQNIERCIGYFEKKNICWIYSFLKEKAPGYFAVTSTDKLYCAQFFWIRIRLF